jgi:hypothetical protein
VTIILSGLLSVHGPNWVIALGAPAAVLRGALHIIEQRTGGIAG